MTIDTTYCLHHYENGWFVAVDRSDLPCVIFDQESDAAHSFPRELDAKVMQLRVLREFGFFCQVRVMVPSVVS